MAKIEVTKSSLDQIISDLQAERTNINSFMTKLDNELSDINQAWQGADATKYTRIMKQEYNKTIKELNECYQSYIDFLSGVFNEYKKVDDKFASDKIEV